MITTDNAPRVCACPDCLSASLPDLPLCEWHWGRAPGGLRGRWIATRAALVDAAAHADTAAASECVRGLLHAEGALVTALTQRPALSDGYTGPLLGGVLA